MNAMFINMSSAFYCTLTFDKTNIQGKGSMVKHLRQRTPIRAHLYPFIAWVSLPVANIWFSLHGRYSLWAHYCILLRLYNEQKLNYRPTYCV